MPKSDKSKTFVPKRPSIQQSQEQQLIEKLAEVLWKHGDHTTTHCRREIVKAGIQMSQLTPGVIRKAEEINSERLRNGFRSTNSDDEQPVKVIVPGDGEFDPALNAKHPVRGAAKVKEETEQRNRLAEIAKGSPLTKAEKEQAEKLKAKPKKEEKPKTEKSTDTSVRGQRYELFGFPVTAVLRWMGKNGFDKDDALKVCQHFGVNCSPATIYIQVKAGENGQRGAPAELSPAQVKELKQIVGK